MKQSGLGALIHYAPGLQTADQLPVPQNYPPASLSISRHVYLFSVSAGWAVCDWAECVPQVPCPSSVLILQCLPGGEICHCYSLDSKVAPAVGLLSALSHSLCSARVTCSNSDIARRNLNQVVCRCSHDRGSAPACYCVFIYLCACGKTSCTRKTSFGAEYKLETSNEATVTKQYSSLLSTDRNLSTCYQTQTAMNDVHIHQYSIWKIYSVLFFLLFVNFLKHVKNGIQLILQFAHSWTIIPVFRCCFCFGVSSHFNFFPSLMECSTIYHLH